MIDFNRKKRILQSLSASSKKNFILFLPCVFAIFVVKLFYAIACNIDILFSDKQGNFLGIKPRGEKSSRKKQDEIINTHRPIIARAFSVLLVFSFCFTFLPISEVLAAVPNADIPTGFETFENTGYYIESATRPVAVKPVFSPEDTNGAAIGYGTIILHWADVDADGYELTYTGNSDIMDISDDNVTGYTEIISNLSSSKRYDFNLRSYKEITLYELELNENYVDGDPTTGEKYIAKATSKKGKIYSGYDNINEILDRQLDDISYYAEYNTVGEVKRPQVFLNTDNNTDTDGYIIYRKEKDDKAYDYIKYIPKSGVINQLVYEDQNAEPTSIYDYKILAYKAISSNSNYDLKNDHLYIKSPDKESTAQIATETAKPNKLEIEPYDDNRALELSWSSVKKASGYVVYRMLEEDYDKISTFILKDQLSAGLVEEIITLNSSTTEYIDTKIVDLTEYRYFVTALNQNGDNLNESTDYAVQTASVNADPKVPTSVFGTPSDGQISLSWNCTDKTVDGFIIKAYKTTEKDGSIVNPPTLEVDETIDKSPFILKNLKNGETYTFEVASYKIVNGVRIESAYGKSKAVVVGDYFQNPQDLIATPDDGLIELEWSKVNGANGYYIYIDGSSTPVDRTTNSYTHLGLINGETHSYYVIPYKFVSGEIVKGPQSDTVTATVGIPLDAPTDVVVEYNEGVNELSWEEPDGAEAYEISASNGSKTFVYNTSNSSYEHTGVRVGETWTYKIRAYKTVNNAKYYSDFSNAVSVNVGEFLSSPTDFTLETSDGSAFLSWEDVDNADGYTVYAYTNGNTIALDTSETEYIHRDLKNGETWNYFVKAYRYVNGEKSYSAPSAVLSTTIGADLPAPNDLTIVGGDRKIDLSWSEVEDAEGYVVYLYSKNTESYNPLTIVSTTNYSHTGLTNGEKYTYMVAAYKNLKGVQIYGSYSFSVSAYASAGGLSDVDTVLNIKGTAPYGISHSELISATCNHDAFEVAVDAYFSNNEQSTNAIKDAMRYYEDGLSSFIIYPFDISLYETGTLKPANLKPTYNIVFTLPIPDKLVNYRNYITVAHLPHDGTNIIVDPDEEIIFENEEDRLAYENAGKITPYDIEILPSAVKEINGNWCIEFVTTSCSPFALVINKKIITDVSSGSGAGINSSADNFNTNVLNINIAPDLMVTNRKLYTISKGRKVYRLKK